MRCRMFLATSEAATAHDFHLAVCMVCNFIEHRRYTNYYTCMGEDAEVPIEAAKKLDITLEEIVSVDGEEEYRMIHPGTMPGWKAQSEADKKENS